MEDTRASTQLLKMVTALHGTRERKDGVAPTHHVRRLHAERNAEPCHRPAWMTNAASGRESCKG